MEGRGKTIYGYDRNYDLSCTVTSLPVSDSENSMRLIFVVQVVYFYLTSINHILVLYRHFLCFIDFLSLDQINPPAFVFLRNVQQNFMSTIYMTV
jgi:hypothetical protein